MSQSGIQVSILLNLKILSFFFLSDVSSFSTKALLVKSGMTCTQCFTYRAICGQGASSELLCWYPNQREFNQNRKAEVLMIRLVNELTRMALSEWQNYHFLVTQCFCKYFKFKIIWLLYWCFYRETSFIDFLCRLTLFSNGFRLFSYKGTSNNTLILSHHFLCHVFKIQGCSYPVMNNIYYVNFPLMG